MKKITPLFLAFLFLAMMLLTGIPAFAENAEEATPEAADVTSLIEQARTLMEAEDYEAALPILREAAGMGDATAQNWLGNFYFNG